MFILELCLFITFLTYTSPFSLTEVHLTPKPALARLHLGINQLPSNSRTVVMHLLLAYKTEQTWLGTLTTNAKWKTIWPQPIWLVEIYYTLVCLDITPELYSQKLMTSIYLMIFLFFCFYFSMT